MTDVKPVTVPDIGDFTDVDVVEVHVAPGDAGAEHDPLVTLETDKPTMDVPAPFAGVVTQVLIKVGDKASEGTQVVALQVGAEGETADETAKVEAQAPSAVRSAVSAEASARPQAPDRQPPAPK